MDPAIVVAAIGAFAVAITTYFNYATGKGLKKRQGESEVIKSAISLMQEMRVDLDKYKERCQDIEEKHSELERQYSELEGKMDEKDERIEELGKENEKLQVKVEALRERLKELENGNKCNGGCRNATE